MTNWREELELELSYSGETLVAINIAGTLYTGERVVIEEGLKRLEHSHTGCIGEIFCAWTETSILFLYRGADPNENAFEVIESMPRNPHDRNPSRIG